jgi:hypothetical protein
MDFVGLPPIPTGSFWQFSSLAVFFLVFKSLTCGAIFPLLDQTKMCIPWIDLSNGLSCT